MYKSDEVFKFNVRDILLHEWDPQGVAWNTLAQDEYDSYVPEVIDLIIHGASVEQIAQRLEWLATEKMGLNPNPERDAEVAGILFGLKDSAANFKNKN